MSEWFGKKCEFQCCQWELCERNGESNYKEAHPNLIFCNHEDNLEDTEGNCRVKICPKIVSVANRLWECVKKGNKDK